MGLGWIFLFFFFIVIFHYIFGHKSTITKKMGKNGICGKQLK